MEPKKSNLTVSALFLALIVFSLLPAISRAQGKVNFTGKWTLNESKSNLGEGNFRGSSQLTVEQKGNDMTIERVSHNRNGDEMTTTDKLTLDGKECDNSSGNRTRKSKASWSADGKTLTINSHMEFSRDGNTFSFDVVETWKLQNSGALEVDYSSKSPRGERNMTLVYEKS